MLLSHSFPFYAQHSLEEFPWQHGHAYRLTVYVEGETEGAGWVMPLDELGAKVMPVLHRVAYTNLNTVVKRPTLERIALHLLASLRGRVPGLVRIRLEREHDTAVEIWAVKTDSTRSVGESIRRAGQDG